MSDRPPDVPDLETRMDEVREVMDAAGSEGAVLVTATTRVLAAGSGLSFEDRGGRLLGGGDIRRLSAAREGEPVAGPAFA
jgi:hypothetical protein